MSEITDLTVSDPDIVRRLINEESRIAIPESIDPDTFWRTLTAAGNAWRFIELVSVRLRPALGRLFLLASQKPELYANRGYKGFDDFLKQVCSQLGLSRSVGYQAKRLVAAFPSLSPERFEKIGIDNLVIAHQFTDETKPSCEAHLEKAEAMTREEFVAYAEKGNYIARGSADKATVHIKTTREVAGILEEFFADEKIQSICNTSKEGEMLVHALQEATSSWTNKNISLLIFSPAIRDSFEAFMNDHRVHRATGTTDRNVLLLWALARALESVTEKDAHA